MLMVILFLGCILLAAHWAEPITPELLWYRELRRRERAVHFNLIWRCIKWVGIPMILLVAASAVLMRLDGY
jgi:hypothetical protein